MLLADKYEARGLKNPTIIVDTNHSNSGKKFKEQPRIALEVISSMNHSPELKPLIKGFLIESYLEEGSCKAAEKIFGKSITDPCLGWEDSKKLVLDIANSI